MCLSSYTIQLPTYLVNECIIHIPSLSFLFFLIISVPLSLVHTAWSGYMTLLVIERWDESQDFICYILLYTFIYLLYLVIPLYLSLMSRRHALVSLETTFYPKYIFIKVSFIYKFNVYLLGPFCGAPNGTCSKIESWPRINENWIWFCFKTICVTLGNKVIL